jgi:hypothetical protein
MSSERACNGRSWQWYELTLGWAGLAVQQAHNQRSSTAGRAQGVCMDGGMRARESGVAAQQRGRCTCGWAGPKRHPEPDALTCL